MGKGKKVKKRPRLPDGGTLLGRWKAGGKSGNPTLIGLKKKGKTSRFDSKIGGSGAEKAEGRSKS